MNVLIKIPTVKKGKGKYNSKQIQMYFPEPKPHSCQIREP